MAQADGVVANGTGSAVRADINGQLAALFTNHSGSTAPATTFAFQTWADTNTNTLKLRNSANDGWIQLARLDGQFDAKTFHGNVTLNAQSDLRLADSDSSNWVAFQAPATVASNITWTLPASDGSSGQALTTNGSGTLSWTSPAASTDIISEGNTSAEVVDTGSDGHFKVVTEGTEALRVNASQQVGIGTTTPTYKCDIDVTGSALRLNSTTSQALLVISSDDAANAKIEFGDESDNDRGAITYDNPNNALIFQANAAERFRCDSSGRLLVGTTSNFVRGDLQVVAGGGGEITIARNDDSVVAGNDIGHLYFATNDSGTGVTCAQIECYAEYDHTASSASTNLRFNTTAQGATTTTEQMRLTSTGNLQFNSGYGSAATAYGVRAWVHFQGTSTVTIAGSGNVSSITDRGTGQYTVGFTTALVNNNYAVCGTATSTGNTDNSYTYNVIYYDYGTTGVKVATYDNGQRLDYTVISMAVVR